MTAKTFLVLGGTSGIGEAIVRRLKLDHGDSQVHAYGKEHFDIRDSEALDRITSRVVPTHVVYSVGVHKMDWLDDIEPTDFQHLMGVNVYGFINTLRSLRRPGLIQAGPISMVAITSDAAWRPMRTSLTYCASKAALEMAVKVASRELAPHQWRVNAVAPGKVEDTPMTTYVDDKVLELRGWTKSHAAQYERSSSAIGRPVTKMEVARVVCEVLCSTSGAFTGAIVPVNGGR